MEGVDDGYLAEIIRFFNGERTDKHADMEQLTFQHMQTVLENGQ